MRSKAFGFSLIEILFVLALLGLISSVCVLHFDSIQSAFSVGNRHPKAVLEDAIQQGRLSAHQLHRKVRIWIEEKEVILKEDSGDTIQTFAFPKRDYTIQCKLLEGSLTPEGTFKPSEHEGLFIPINEEGFIASTFVDIACGEDHEKYEVDIFTGELKPIQW